MCYLTKVKKLSQGIWQVDGFLNSCIPLWKEKKSVLVYSYSYAELLMGVDIKSSRNNIKI